MIVENKQSEIFEAVPYYPLVERQYGLGRTLASTKVGGWFSRAFKKIQEYSTYIPIVNAICDIAIRLLEEDFGKDSERIGDGTLTPSETKYLDNWDLQHFAPFLETLTYDVSSALKRPNINAQLLEINVVLKKICAVKKYFNTTANPNLSAKGLVVRDEYIEIAFSPLIIYIQNQLGELQMMNATDKTLNFSYGTLITSRPDTVFSCSVYVKNATTSTAPIMISTAPIVIPPKNGGVVSPPKTVAPAPAKSNTGLYIAGAVLLSLMLVLRKRKKPTN